MIGAAHDRRGVALETIGKDGPVSSLGQQSGHPFI
jgi:hypothetical protein